MESSPPERRYDRAEMAEILRRASEDSAGVPAQGPGDDGLTLREIEGIAREVGIDAAKVRGAALALPAEPPQPAIAGRVRLATAVPGALDADGLNRVTDYVLSTIGPGSVRTGDGSVRYDAQKDDLGHLVVEVRRKGEDVAVSVWAERATTRGVAMFRGAIFGAAIGANGAWSLQPGLLEFFGLAAAVTAVGVGCGFGLWNHSERRWQQRLAEVHERLVAHVAELVSGPRDGQAVQLPRGDDAGR